MLGLHEGSLGGRGLQGDSNKRIPCHGRMDVSLIPRFVYIGKVALRVFLPFVKGGEGLSLSLSILCFLFLL